MKYTSRSKVILIITAFVLSVVFMLPSIMGDDNPLSFITDKKINLGLDLQGGSHFVYEIDESEIEENPDILMMAVEKIRNRVDQFGVREPQIVPQGTNRIIIQLPGVKDATKAKEIIGKTAKLKFQIVVEGADVDNYIEIINEKLNSVVVADTAVAEEGDYQIIDLKAFKQNMVVLLTSDMIDNLEKRTIDAILKAEFPTIYENEEEYALLKKFMLENDNIEKYEEEERAFLNKNMSKIYASKISILKKKLRKTPALTDLLATFIPARERVEFGFGTLKQGREDITYRELFFINQKAELTGEAVEDANVQIGKGLDPATANKPYVGLVFSDEGSKTFANVTGRNIEKRLAIVLDGIVHSAPVIKDKIHTKTAQITGTFSMEDAKNLATVIRVGSLPTDVFLIEERTVGPSLGEDSIEKSKTTMMYASLFIIVFMVVWYKLTGLAAVIALGFNVLILMAFLAGFGASLTLPGVAGIILTIGMAVDANVLINERLREEIANGKSLLAALQTSFDRVFTTILDANITTFITAIILYQFGTGPIKGFAVTLSIGLLSSMFTAIIFTRVLLETTFIKFNIKKISY